MPPDNVQLIHGYHSAARSCLRTLLCYPSTTSPHLTPACPGCGQAGVSQAFLKTLAQLAL